MTWDVSLFTFYDMWSFFKYDDFTVLQMTYSWHSMVVILLSVLYNHDSLIIKLHQKRSTYLDEGWLIIVKFKVWSVAGIRNKNVLALFICKPTQRTEKLFIYKNLLFIYKMYYLMDIEERGTGGSSRKFDQLLMYLKIQVSMNNLEVGNF